jgi:hypothetical protein
VLVFVSDMRHYLDLPEAAPGAAHKVAQRLGDIVRAGTAGDVGSTWISALACHRRPSRRPCPGRIAVLRDSVEGPIQWQCTGCGDDGVVSGWQDSPFDLRPRRPHALPAANAGVVVPQTVAATLRQLMLLDPDCERLVFGAKTSGEHAVLTCDDGDLEELIGYVAAEANHEENPRRQRRIDDAFAALSAAAQL